MIETERLLLREWRDDDIAPLHAICSDLRVMAFIGPVQTLGEVEAAVDRQCTTQASNGHCYWAVEHKRDARLIGFCGLLHEPEGTPVAGEIDIGWRLAFDCWGYGYAQEAAQASLAWGWQMLDIDRIWAITVPTNLRSRALMERLGMGRHDDLDFDHPGVPDGSPLKRHVTYSVARP